MIAPLEPKPACATQALHTAAAAAAATATTAATAAASSSSTRNCRKRRHDKRVMFATKEQQPLADRHFSQTLLFSYSSL